MIIVTQELLTRLTAYCVGALPDEACAVLLGKQTNEDVRITGYLPIPNVSVYPRTAFVGDPEAWVSIVLNKELSRQAVGIIHSHPAADAVPSASDRNAEARNGWHFATYWILSLRQPAHPIVRAYRIVNGSCSEQTICVDVE